MVNFIAFVVAALLCVTVNMTNAQGEVTVIMHVPYTCHINFYLFQLGLLASSSME